MVKYVYNTELEVFQRIDHRGYPLRVNIVEARRIKSMMDLGIKAPTIMNKIDFVNKISMTSLRTIMNNIQSGNLELDGDYPMPTESMKDMDVEIRMNKLENDLKKFEKILNRHDDILSEIKAPTGENTNNNVVGRIKQWLLHD